MNEKWGAGMTGHAGRRSVKGKDEYLPRGANCSLQVLDQEILILRQDLKHIRNPSTSRKICYVRDLDQEPGVLWLLRYLRRLRRRME